MVYSARYRVCPAQNKAPSVGYTEIMAPYKHRLLLWQFVKRDVMMRYRGSLLGVAWAIVNPLLMLLVYTFVFRDIFKVKWHGSDSLGGLEFALQLFAGLAVFNFFSDCANRASRLVVEQANLVKKVVFPLEIMAWVSTLSGLFHFAVSIAILVVVSLVAGALQPTVWMLPLVLLPLIPLALALSWWLSALGVYVRDVAPVVSLGTGLLMFLSPIFYPLAALPERWQAWLSLNPLAPIIEGCRAVVLVGVMPDWRAWFVVLSISCLAAWLGLRFFNWLRGGFADVL